jgi:hypothetical protein
MNTLPEELEEPGVFIVDMAIVFRNVEKSRAPGASCK